MVKIGYKVLLAADVWTYTPRTLTNFTGTPRTNLVGVDETIHTRLDEKISGIEDFKASIPATPSAGTWGEKFKPFSDPKEIIYPLYQRSHERATFTMTNVGTSYRVITDMIMVFNFDEIKIKRIGFKAGSIAGNEGGIKGIRLYNVTDGVEICSATWSGTAGTNVSAFGDITLTGVKQIEVQWRGSSATEDLWFSDLVIVLIREDA